MAAHCDTGGPVLVKCLYRCVETLDRIELSGIYAGSFKKVSAVVGDDGGGKEW